MEFQKYQHIRRYGEPDIANLTSGTCYVFPKIDGGCATCWLGDDDEMHLGLRKFEVTEASDEGKFWTRFHADERLVNFCRDNPDLRLFGEYLTPHTLLTYQDTAWNKFYVFDVARPADNDRGHEYLDYEEYAPLLDKYGIDYIKPIAVLSNPTIADFEPCFEKTNFLVQDGKGNGEGIVIKNYAYRTRNRVQTWGKIVFAEFKKQHQTTFYKQGPTKEETAKSITDVFITEALLAKEFCKFKEQYGWQNSDGKKSFFANYIWHTFIDEEMWNVIKKFKNPVIDFGYLSRLVQDTVKFWLAEHVSEDGDLQ